MPKPFKEIFVYSPNFEAIYLKSGKVARGGVRLSDRHEDFRTEILGLMRTQFAKNAIIVPLGSKAGFIVKNTESMQPEEIKIFAIECYKNFLRGMLDITDNIIDHKIVKPQNIVIYDESV